MPGDEDQLARSRAPGAPLQIVIGVQRLAVVVNAEERHVQVVARISEVIRISAVESGLLFRRKDQAHIGVSLVLVKPVLATLIEREYVGAKSGLVLAILFDSGDF